MIARPLEWQVAVFCQNESPRLAHCLTSISAAVGLRPGLITVIINGSTDGSAAIAAMTGAKIAIPVEVVSIPCGDKANAINSFLFERNLRRDANLYFFIDGYVTICPGALEAMAARLADCPAAAAASGVAGNGRSEVLSTRQTVDVGGVLKGQLFALRPSVVERMVESGLRLPIGLYRGDGLLGSMIAHDLDAINQPWVNSRIVGVADATFELDELSPFRLRDVRRQFRRKIRQMRGKLENAAISEIIYAHGYAALPRFADDMIRDYLAAHAVPHVSPWDALFMALALRHHRNAVRPEADRLLPKKLPVQRLTEAVEKAPHG